jgi:hypothetical protein
MKSAIQVEIPKFLAHLPVHHGLPVPFSQAWINDAPDFRAVDPNKTVQCVQEKLCAICGRKLGEHSYFACGPRSKASHLFTDPPMHKPCVEFAAQICPFLSGRKLEYSDRPAPAETTKVYEMASDSRPEQMVILTAWTKNTRLVQHGDSVLIEAGNWIGAREISIKRLSVANLIPNIEPGIGEAHRATGRETKLTRSVAKS